MNKSGRNDSMECEITVACLMLHLKAHLLFHFREHLKVHWKLKKKNAFDDKIDGPLFSAIESAPVGTLNLQLRMYLAIYIKTQKKVHLGELKGAFEAALKGCTCWCIH